MLRKFKNLAHAFEAEAANLVYRRPSRSIPTIGVTGTDGKTTTSSLIYHILNEAGFNPAVVTTVGAQVGSEEFDTGLHTTTPSAFALQKYIKKAVDSKCNYLVLEVTSHALDQNRVRGIDFKIGVITNITQDHLDYHGTLQNYIKAKSRLFKHSEIVVLNRDDQSYEPLLSFCKNKKIYTYSLESKADFNIKSTEIEFPENYSFNYENFLAAVSVAKILGIPNEKIQLAISTFKFPAGRQEIVYDKEFKVVVDFAHTANSFDSVLPELKKATKGRLIHVFGAAGSRDKTKRPMMGKIAGQNDDVIILTAEDPRREDITVINEQIKSGIEDYKGQVIEIPDRQKAIDLAISMAQPGDTVVLTGKGHERSLNLGHGEIPWDEKKAIEHGLQAFTDLKVS